MRTLGVGTALAGLLMVSSESSGTRFRAMFDISKSCVIWIDLALVSLSLVSMLHHASCTV